MKNTRKIIKDIPCKTCKKLTCHVSHYCLAHRHAWREGYKAGVQLRESVTYMTDDILVKSLEDHATHPGVIFHNYHLLFIRAANLIKKLRKAQEK